MKCGLRQSGVGEVAAEDRNVGAGRQALADLERSRHPPRRLGLMERRRAREAIELCVKSADGADEDLVALLRAEIDEHAGVAQRRRGLIAASR